MPFPIGRLGGIEAAVPIVRYHRVVEAAIPPAGRLFECSHGAQLHDFIYIEDLAPAIVAVLESEATGVINLASGEARSLRDIIGFFARRLGKEDLVRFGARMVLGMDAEPMITANIDRLRVETRWVPSFGWEDGANRTLVWWDRCLRRSIS